MMDIRQVLLQLPQYIFYLKNYNAPIELSHEIKKLKMTRMIYEVQHLYYGTNNPITDIIKYGQGADNEWERNNTWGSRIYRQAGNIPGWGKNMLTGPNGEDMKFIIKDYTNATKRIVHKDDIAFKVWDFTNFKFPSKSRFKRYLEKVENHLIEEYICQNSGNMPIGNIKTESHAKEFSFVDDSHFDSLFELEV